MISVLSREEVLRRAEAIRVERYAEAKVVFASGSLLRGEGTPSSDLDLVVVYTVLPNAFRESFTCDGLPVEAFVHDQETLEYFFIEVDRAAGAPVLARMIADGVALPATSSVAEALTRRATVFIDEGPPSLDPGRVERLRYVVTDLMDDLAHPRSISEMVGASTRLFETMADFYLRFHGHWSGQGKGLVRAIRRAEPELEERLSDAMQTAIATQDTAAFLQVTTEMLDRCGGRLFDGLKVDAPAAWRTRSARLRDTDD